MKKTLLLLIGANFLVGLIFNAYLPFYIDEAYYWLWSKFLACGYLDHPPMIAFSIFATTLFSDGAFFVRLSAWICYALSAYFIYLLALRAYSQKVALISATIVSLSPALTMGMSLATPDAPLALFWTLTLYFGYKAFFEEENAYNFILAGIFLGLSMDSKYTAVLLALFLLIFAIFYAPKKFLSYKIYLVALFAFICFAPVLWWNYKHNFISFNFQLKREILTSVGFDEFWQFFGGQFLLFSPIFGLVLLYDVYKWRDWSAKDRFFAITAYGVLAFFFYKSFYGHTELNWSAPAYISASILAAKRVENSPKILNTGLILCIIIGLVIRFPFLFGLEGARNPHQRLFGYAEVAQRVKELKTSKDSVMSDHLAEASILWFYLGDTITIPTNSRDSMFDIWGLGKSAPLKKGVYISRDEKMAELKSRYKNVVLIETFSAQKKGFKPREFYIYRVEP